MPEVSCEVSEDRPCPRPAAAASAVRQLVIRLREPVVAADAAPIDSIGEIFTQLRSYFFYMILTASFSQTNNEQPSCATPRIATIHIFGRLVYVRMVFYESKNNRSLTVKPIAPLGISGNFNRARAFLLLPGNEGDDVTCQ